LYHLFKYIYIILYSIWCVFIPGISFANIEHPKGEYSIFLCFCYIYIARLRIRCADYVHICLLDCVLRGFMLHDLVAVIGNIDVVFGSVDR